MWGNEKGRRGAEEEGKERRGGGLRLWCCHATVTRAAVIGLHIEGFCGAAGWANSQLDLSDGIQSSSLPSLLCSFLLSFPPSPLLLWHVHFFLFFSSPPCLFTHLYFIPHTNLHKLSLTAPIFFNHTLIAYFFLSLLFFFHTALSPPGISLFSSPFSSLYFFSPRFFALMAHGHFYLTRWVSKSTSHPCLSPPSLVTHIHKHTHTCKVVFS